MGNINNCFITQQKKLLNTIYWYHWEKTRTWKKQKFLRKEWISKPFWMKVIFLKYKKIHKFRKKKNLNQSIYNFTKFNQASSLKGLINNKILGEMQKSLFLYPNSHKQLIFEIVHMIFMLYNAFALPFYVFIQ